MASTKWDALSPLQVGRYGEYYAKMEFASYGFEVYTSEVDVHGVGFVVKHPDGNIYYEVQVKTVRDWNKNPNIAKSKMKALAQNRLVCLIHIVGNNLPKVYLIPATAWGNPSSGILADNDYINKKSSAEWTIRISKKYKTELDLYEIEKIIPNIK